MDVLRMVFFECLKNLHWSWAERNCRQFSLSVIIWAQKLLGDKYGLRYCDRRPVLMRASSSTVTHLDILWRIDAPVKSPGSFNRMY